MTPTRILCSDGQGPAWPALPWLQTNSHVLFRTESLVVKVPLGALGDPAERAAAHRAVHRQVRAGRFSIAGIPTARQVLCQIPGRAGPVVGLAYEFQAGRPLSEHLAEGSLPDATALLRGLRDLGHLLLRLSGQGWSHGQLTLQHILWGEQGFAGLLGLGDLRPGVSPTSAVLHMAGILKAILTGVQQRFEDQAAGQALWELCAAAYGNRYRHLGLWGFVRDLQFVLEALGEEAPATTVALFCDLTGVRLGTGATLNLAGLLPNLTDLTQERYWPVVFYVPDREAVAAVGEGLNWTLRPGRPELPSLISEIKAADRVLAIAGPGNYHPLLQACRHARKPVTVVAFDTLGKKTAPPPQGDGPVVSGIDRYAAWLDLNCGEIPGVGR